MALKGPSQPRSAENASGATIGRGLFLTISNTNQMTIVAAPGTSPNRDINGVCSADVLDGAVGSYSEEEGELVKIKLGGTVSKGDMLTATTLGEAIQASSGNETFLVAQEDGVDNDFILALISRGYAS